MAVLGDTEFGLASTLLDELPDPVFIKDGAHRWVLVNPAFCAFLGKRPEELLGRSDFDFFPPEEAAVFYAEDDRAFASGGALENEEVLTDLAGNRHIIVTKKIAITAANGERYLIGIIRDLTERRRVEARLARAEQLASIGALGASVAHEINNPLTSVSANLSFVREQLFSLDSLLSRGESARDLVEDLQSALEDAEDGTRRVARIVEDLRGLAKVDAGVTASLPQAVAAAVRLVAGKARERAAITVNVAADLPRVRGAEGRICQVLVNLLANAIHAFSGGHPASSRNPASGNQIVISAQQATDVVVLEVADNGPGIAPETLRALQPRIHDAREPLNVAHDDERTGLGLGLSISFALMSALGGSMAFRANPTGGTIVCLEFRQAVEVGPPSPVSPRPPNLLVDADARAAVSPVVGRDETLRNSGGLSSPSIATEARLPRVLVVDDEAMILRLMTRALSSEFEVATAQSVDKATHILAGASFDALISDVRMPGRTGIDLLAYVENVLPTLAKRFLFVTGGADGFSEALFRSARPVLQKPFSVDELRAAVRSLLLI